MNPLITFETPKGYLLQGAWLGTHRAQTVYIFIHGLTGSLFSRGEVAALLARKPKTACMLFNNRGNGYISPLRKHAGKKNQKLFGGTVHEVFEECRDDIVGAVAFAKNRGVKRIILVGHSTGCQKAVWYLTGKPAQEVRGAVLLAPLSDYASIKKAMRPTAYARLRAHVEKLAQRDRHALVPPEMLPFPELLDAQRWLSLYTPENSEEIFTYASGRAPKTLQKTRVPLLALFASEDQHADRPAHELATWFVHARPASAIHAHVVDAPDHGFSGKEHELARMVAHWTRAL